MNKQQEINDLLAKFRKKCGIEDDCGDLVGNLKAELEEAVDATDSTHKAEEFADIYIIAANAVEQCGFDSGDTGYLVKAVPHCLFACINYIQTDIYFIGFKAGIGDSLYCIARDAKLAIQFIGYNPESVILEKCKLINTRTGKMNEAGTKWCKDKNQDPATLYKMNIEGCLL